MQRIVDSSRRGLALLTAGLVAAGSLVSGAFAAPAATAAPSSNGTVAVTASTFVDPPSSVRPKYRWWVPLAYTEKDELRRELQDMKDTGAGGAEVIGFNAAGTGSTTIDFLTQYGWGTQAWADQLKTMLDAATDLDLGLDITVGPKWPSIVPTVSDVNDSRAAQQLVASSSYVAGGSTFTGTLTTGLSPAPPTGAKTTLVAALLARCTNADCQTQPTYTRLIERASVIDVTSEVAADNTLSYPVPGDSTQKWVMMAFYQTADGSTRTNMTATTPNYYLDHLSAQGLEATTDFYETSILPTIQDSIRANGSVDFFEDSLELGNSQKWTWDFREQWQTRRGYDPVTVLPALIGAGTQGVTDRPSFDFSDGSGSRVRTDYRQTWSDVYINVRLKPLKAWANDHGMNLRVQPYGTPVDTAEASAAVDIPEGESLAFNNNIEDYKLEAVGARLNGTAVVSNECCAIRDTVWDTRAGGTQEPGNLFGVFRSFAGGVTQVVWHGYPYLTQGTQTAGAVGTIWPGMTYSNNISFAEAFGSKGSPSWQDYKAINDQIARLQLVLRQGQAKVDVAVYWQDFGMSGHGTTGYGDDTLLTSTSELAAEGYTYDYVSPAHLAREDATVKNGRLFADTSAYKALVLFDQETMATQTAERIIALADDGLPVVIVGQLPTTTPGHNDAAAADSRLAGLVAELATKVTLVDSLDNLPGALDDLGVNPDASHATTSSDVVSVHRQTADTDYYYLFNQEQTRTEQTLTLQGEGAPYLLDSWTGEITPITNYERVAGGVKLRVALEGATAKVIALTERTGDGFEPGVQARQTSPGAGSVSETVTLTDWSLSVQGWSAGPSGKPGDTAKVELGSVDLVADEDGALPAWKDINPTNGFSLDLTDVSGVGTYVTTVTLSDSWSGVRKAWLDLGEVVDTARVSVNGNEIAVDPQDTGHVEVGKYLKVGENTVSVRVSSTLLNAVRVAPSTGASGRARAAYGMLGAVRLVPHEGDKAILGVELLDKAMPLGEGGTNQARVTLSNYSTQAITVTLAPTTSDEAVQATVDSPTVDLAAGQSVTSVVRLRGDKASGTSSVTVGVSASNGASGKVKFRLEHSRNLALNTLGSRYPRTIASSNQDRYVPEFTTDGNASTFWVSGGQFAGQGPTVAKPEYLGVDLGEPTVLKAISLWGKTDYGPRNYQVQTSNDGKAWNTVATVTDAPKYGKLTPFTPQRARYVRALITSGYYTSSPGSNTQVYEFSVFGATTNLAYSAIPTASSTNSKFNVWAINDGAIHGQSDYALWNVGNGWNDSTKSTYPDWVTLTWPEPVTVSSARVFSVDNGTNPAATFSVKDLTVQAFVDGSWLDVASVVGNNAATRDVSFAPIATTALRLLITATNGVNDYSRLVEVEAYCEAEGCPALDRTPPEVAVTTQGTASGSWIGPDGRVAITATDAAEVVSVEYRVDGGAWQKYTTAFGLDAGLHRVDARATDANDNRSATVSVQLGMDATAPVTSASAARVPGDPDAIEVTLTSTDSESGVARIWYSLDGLAPVEYTGPFQVSNPGEHTVVYSAVDAVGNTEDAQTLTTDKSALGTLVERADDLSEDDFTAGSWPAFAGRLAAARSVLADVNVIQSEVDAARTALAEAMEALVVRGDPAVLGALIDLADQLTGKLDGFTAQSVEAFRSSLTQAKATFADRSDKNQAELDAAATALRTAVNGLEQMAPAVDKSVLKAALAAARTVSNTDGTYTSDSWSELQKQITAGQQVLEAPTATQAKVDSAVNSVTSALAGLKVVPVVKPPVVDPAVVKIKLNQTQLRLVKGKSLTLADGVYYSAGKAASYSGRVTWTSSNPKVATVSADGVIKARKTGTVTLTVRPKEKSASGETLVARIKVTVVTKKSKSKVTKVTAAVPSAMKVGQLAFITGTYSSSKATGVKVTYSSSNSRVAAIDAVGAITARAKGKVKIKVKAAGKSRTYTITVT